jgi:phosphoglycolate phosphatase-like HAD superfamily hydrolase
MAEPERVMDVAEPAALFDVDGTLVDSSYHHALAWARAFDRFGYRPPLWRIHRAIGMGGDQLVRAVLDDEAEERHGDDLRAAWGAEFDPLLPEVKAFDRVYDLVEAVAHRGFRVVLASSAPQQHLDRYLELTGIARFLWATTTADDVEQTKPAPDIVAVALDRAGSGDGVMIGDSPWDIKAARRVNVPTMAVRTGGFSEAELRDAGAVSVHSSVAELLDEIDRTPLARTR